MKILHVTPTFVPSKFGGVKTVSYNLSKNLAHLGHQVTVYTTDADIGFSRLKDVQDVKNPNFFKIKYFKNINNLLAFKYRLFLPVGMLFTIRNEISRFDIIHIHDFRNFLSLIVYHYAVKFDVPYVLQAHGALPRISAKQKLKLIYDVLFGYSVLRGASKVIALNQGEAEQYREMGVPNEKIAIIPNGIDLSQYNSLPPKGAFKKKFNIPENKKIILYLGRIHKIKGIDFLVKAYAHIVNNRKYGDATLVIVGPDDGFLSKIKSLISSLGVSNLILLTGPLYGKDKIEAYIDSDINVLPSRHEIWGMTVLEAYACGRPVIASNVGGLKDLIIDGTTGLLVNPERTDQLAESILYLLNDVRSREMGLKGKRLVKENYAIEKVIASLEKLYIETISADLS